MSVDPQFARLITVSDQLKPDYLGEDLAWEGSPFAWIKARPSRQKGAIAERLLEGWLRLNGLDVKPAGDSEADRIVAGHRVEIKSSTLWAGGSYRFQQFRDQECEIALCLGLSPNDANFWAIPKKTIIAGWGRQEGLVSQHGGSEGRDTAWLAVDPSNPHKWLKPFGGSLNEGLQALKSLLAA